MRDEPQIETNIGICICVRRPRIEGLVTAGALSFRVCLLHVLQTSVTNLILNILNFQTTNELWQECVVEASARTVYKVRM